MTAPMTQQALIELRRQRVQDTFQLDPTVIITLRGKEYTLEFNNLAVKQVYRELGVNILSAGIQGLVTDPVNFGALLRIGLQEHHPDLDQDAVDRLYNHRLYPYILDRLLKAVEMFLPDMSDVEPPKPNEPEAGEEVRVQDPTERITPLG